MNYGKSFPLMNEELLVVFDAVDRDKPVGLRVSLMLCLFNWIVCFYYFFSFLIILCLFIFDFISENITKVQ